MARWSLVLLESSRLGRRGTGGRALLLASLLLLLVIVLGTVGYHLIEGWSLWDGFWMVMITLTSIGYGEVHPLSDGGRLWTVLLIISGLSLGTYALTRLTSAIVEGDLLAGFQQRRRQRIVAQLSRHYIVVGAGRLGMSVIEEVRGAGLPICVVEHTPERAAALERQGIPVIQGDGSTDDVLREAGIERAAGLAVAVPSGAEAIFVTLSARHLNPHLPIATRAADHEEAVKARRAGATSVVSPYRMGGWRMAHGLIRPSTSTFLDLATFAGNDDLLIDELLLSAASPVVGRTLKELSVRVRHGVLVVAIRRREGEMLAAPDANTRLEDGDVVIVVGRPEQVRRFAQSL